MPAEKLPGPDFGSSSTSVFSNPFIEAENAKKAILEKHVKMVATKEDTKIINGKKICWNYRKGRCRFGHKCAFAHDSDLQKTAEELEEENKLQTTVICQNGLSKNIVLPDTANFEPNNDAKTANAKKKRPGLSQGLAPGKKVMKMFHKQQDKTTPWLSHR